MLTREIFFGMNILSLAGFLLMGMTLTLSRQGQLRVPAAFGLMAAGTVLIFLGIYVSTPASP